MCIISSKIKFCSCVDENIQVDELNHYWVLNRYNKRKNSFTIGEIKLPYSSVEIDFNENLNIITNALEEQNTFDKKINFKEKDVLQIVLNNSSENHEEILEFEFEYKSGKWQRRIDEDPFYLMNNFDEVHSGEIKEIE